jgi:putative addiction module component (TIGR02574 family)
LNFCEDKMSTYTEILQAAMALEPVQREELAVTLWESVEGRSPEDTPELSDAWREEIARRSAAYKRGDLQPIPWAQARDEVRRKYERHA